jgi:benzoylformate decarboxylase
VLPTADDVNHAATLLTGARRPIIVMGDGIAWHGAQGELLRVAELLGAEIWGADNSEVNVPYDHPLYRGSLGHMFGEASAKVVREADAVLIVGTYVFPEVFPLLGDVFAADAKVVHVDLNAYEIGKNHRVDLGLVSDPMPTLAALADRLMAVLGPNDLAAARERISATGARSAEARRPSSSATRRTATTSRCAHRRSWRPSPARSPTTRSCSTRRSRSRPT